MTAKIILSESTSVTHSTATTVYTVPTDKAARIRVSFQMEGGGSTTAYRIEIGSPGAQYSVLRKLSASDDVFSGISGVGSKASNLVGLVDGAGTLDVEGNAIDHIVVPWPHDFYLAVGDTVKFYIDAGDALDHLIQVMGVEDDA